MPGPTTVSQGGDVIRVYRPGSDESLVIVLHEVFEDSALDLVGDGRVGRVAFLGYEPARLPPISPAVYDGDHAPSCTARG